jgi:hypothetical protein
MKANHQLGQWRTISWGGHRRLYRRGRIREGGRSRIPATGDRSGGGGAREAAEERDRSGGGGAREAAEDLLRSSLKMRRRGRKDELLTFLWPCRG